MQLSIIVPLAPNEKLNLGLLTDFNTLAAQAQLSANSELILVSSCEETLRQAVKQIHTVTLQLRTVNVSNITAGINGRAACLNAGANAALGTWLFFLHADSYFEPGFYVPLMKRIETEATGLYYFNLRFSDGSPLMQFNAWGVRFRCRFLKTPFGDQGLLMMLSTFEALGRYDMTAPYGEDHLLVRRAKREGRAIVSLGKCIYTSARKYSQNGWLKTTLKHQWMWYAQTCSDIRKGRC